MLSLRNRWIALGILPFLAILLPWDLYQGSRFSDPMKRGHEAWIGRQIGRTARNHVVLGLGTTKGANITTVHSDESLEIHRSYSPLASWLVAIPMALGVPFHSSIKLSVFVSMNLFFFSLWRFAGELWGRRVGLLATVFAATFPIVLFQYGLTCIFEILALGPLMASVALLARPERGRLGWIGLVAMSISAVMNSWICWLVILPGLLVDFRRGNRVGAICVGGLSVVIPTAVHLLTCGLASGDLKSDLIHFMGHVLERLSTRTDQGSPIGYSQVATLLWTRWIRGLGLVPMVCVSLCLVAIWSSRFRVTGWYWFAVLFVFALPLNLAPNIAYYHDFFVMLFVPVAAISCAYVTDCWIAQSRDDWRGRARVAFVLTLFLGLDVIPRTKLTRLSPLDYEQEAICNEIGRMVEPGDFVIANDAFCFISDGHAQQVGVRLGVSPLPFFAGQMAQSVAVAMGTDEASRLAETAGPGRRVVIVEVGDKPWDLPSGFERLTPLDNPLIIAIKRTPTRDPSMGRSEQTATPGSTSSRK